MNENAAHGAATTAGLKLIGFWYLLGGLMLLGVAILSLVPLPEVGVGDKFSHVVTYLLLAAWFGLLAANRLVLCWTVVGLMAFGILLEILQGMTSYRYAEWADILANGGGILIGIWFYLTPLSRMLKLVDRKLSLILAR